MMEIDRFVKQIAARLPEKITHVRNDKTFIYGKELKLTGVKDFKGKPLQDDLVYELEVPVLEGKFNPDGNGGFYPTIKRTDHEAELRRAYLAKGLQGIYGYLSPYLSQESLQRVKDTFMRATN